MRRARDEGMVHGGRHLDTLRGDSQDCDYAVIPFGGLGDHSFATCPTHRRAQDPKEAR
jgi:hypothetical protein